MNRLQMARDAVVGSESYYMVWLVDAQVKVVGILYRLESNSGDSTYKTALKPPE